MMRCSVLLLLAACAPVESVAEEPAPSDPAAWARYTIEPGKHGATLSEGQRGNPLAGLVHGVTMRDYEFAFDPSAAYVIVDKVEPNDELDWNKLPGLSDCDRIDLAKEGAMFAWRWAEWRTPRVLEVTAYANNDGKHLPMEDPPLIALSEEDLQSDTPLRYKLWIEPSRYRFSISGTIRGRSIDAETTITRRCTEMDPSALEQQWAAGLYFGGTSLAPQRITGRVFERTGP